MPTFEFVVEGPIATVNTKEHNRQRYQRWIRTVREAEHVQWLADSPPLSDRLLIVSVSNYYRVTKDKPAPPDVDNVLKPILDAMNGVVYHDDSQVFRVISDRYDREAGIPMPSPLVAAAMAKVRSEELLYIRIEFSEEG